MTDAFTKRVPVRRAEMMHQHRARNRVSVSFPESGKPIVRSSPPQHFNQDLLMRTSHHTRTLLQDRAAQNRSGRLLSLASRYSWSTTSGDAAAEGSESLPKPKYPVPVTTLEEQADPVTQRSRPRRNLIPPEPSVWQKLAKEWDLLQARCPMKPRTKPRGINLLVLSVDKLSSFYMYYSQLATIAFASQTRDYSAEHRKSTISTYYSDQQKKVVSYISTQIQKKKITKNQDIALRL